MVAVAGAAGSPLTVPATLPKVPRTLLTIMCRTAKPTVVCEGSRFQVATSAVARGAGSESEPSRASETTRAIRFMGSPSPSMGYVE